MIRNIIIFTLSALVFSIFGCEEVQRNSKPAPGTFQKTCIFMPHKISFNQLTEISKSGQINAYIDVTDEFHSRMKTQSIWRFELYTKAARSAEPSGDRVQLWTDIDLTQAVENNNYWQDYLRCYKFELNPQSELVASNYILQATCFTSEGKRLTDTIELKR